MGIETPNEREREREEDKPVVGDSNSTTPYQKPNLAKIGKLELAEELAEAGRTFTETFNKWSEYFLNSNEKSDVASGSGSNFFLVRGMPGLFLINLIACTQPMPFENCTGEEEDYLLHSIDWIRHNKDDVQEQMDMLGLETDVTVEDILTVFDTATIVCTESDDVEGSGSTQMQKKTIKVHVNSPIFQDAMWRFAQASGVSDYSLDEIIQVSAELELQNLSEDYVPPDPDLPFNEISYKMYLSSMLGVGNLLVHEAAHIATKERHKGTHKHVKEQLFAAAGDVDKIALIDQVYAWDASTSLAIYEDMDEFEAAVIEEMESSLDDVEE